MQPWGTLHWRHVVGRSYLLLGVHVFQEDLDFCFEAVKLVESDLARLVFHLLAVTPDLLWRSYTIYSLT